MIQEYENNTLTNSYIYGEYIDDPIAYIYNNQTYYYVKDRQYTIQAITDSIGNIVESYSYNSFGIMSIKDANQNVILNSNVNNTITYTGRRIDQESGLYYYRNRMYSSELGRFMQRDPKGYIDGMNLYAYTKNNPLKYLDAMGTTALKNINPMFNQDVLNGIQDPSQLLKVPDMDYGINISEKLYRVFQGSQVGAGVGYGVNFKVSSIIQLSVSFNDISGKQITPSGIQDFKESTSEFKFNLLGGEVEYKFNRNNNIQRSYKFNSGTFTLENMTTISAGTNFIHPSTGQSIKLKGEIHLNEIFK